MTTLLKKDYGYSNVLWEDVLERIKEIIRDEYNISPYISPELNTSINSPFRVWIDNQETTQLASSNWYKQYSISINQYFKEEKNVNFYKKVYEDAERLYEIFFHNMGSQNVSTTYKVKFFNARPESINISQEGEYFKIELIYNLTVNRDDNFNYASSLTAPSSLRASTRALEPVYNFWALDFDGTDDKVSLGEFNTTGDLTVSIWFQIRTYSNQKTLINLAASTVNKGIFILMYSGRNDIDIVSKYNAGDDSRYNFRTTTTFDLNKWYNIVVTKSDSGSYAEIGNVYINGVLETRATPTLFVTFEQENKIGETNSSNWNGLISDTAIFNSVLSSSAISAMYNNGQPILLTENQGSYNSSGDLLAYYRMGSGSGDDRSTNGLVADQVDSSLGVELWNSTSADTWASTEGGSGENITITHSDGEYIFEGNGGDAIFITYLSNRDNVGSMGSLSSLLTANKIYKVVFTAKTENASGTNYVRVVGNETTTHSMTTTYTTYTTYMIADSSPSETDHYIQGYTLDDNEKIYIKDVSVKEISGNPGKMVSFDGLDFRTNVPLLYDKALFSNSLVFDGVDDHINCGVIPEISAATNLSISVWFKASETSSNHKFFTVRQNDNNNLEFGISGNTLIAATEVGGDIYRRVSFTDTTSWHHAVMVYDGGNTTLKIYLDSVEQTTIAYTAGTIPSALYNFSSKDAYISKVGTLNAGYFNGLLADVAVFNSSLNQDNIDAIYNSGKPIDLTCDSGNYNNANNLLGYWKMGDGYLDEIPSAIVEGGIIDQVTPIIDEEELINTQGDGPGDTVPTHDFSNGLTGWVISDFYDVDDDVSWDEAAGESVIARDGQVIMVANGTHSFISADNVIPANDGGIYRLEIDVESFTMGEGGEGWRYSFNGAAYPTVQNITTIGKHIIYFKWNESNPADLRISPGSAYTAEERANFGLNTLIVNSASIRKVHGNVGICLNMNASAQSISVPE